MPSSFFPWIESSLLSKNKEKRSDTMLKKIVTIMLLLASLLMLPSTYMASENSNENDFKDVHKFVQYDVIIDIGHGGFDGGTNHGELLEKNLNLAIGSKLYQALKEKGYRVGVTRLHDYQLSDDSPYGHIKSRHRRDLKQRALIAEGLNPKVFVSIHINFASSPRLKGPMIIHQKEASSYLLAQLLQEELNQLTNTNGKTKATQNYFLLQNIKQPCLIAEVGFMSNPTERRKLQEESYQLQLAEHMAEAIENYLYLYP
jgi:N-acetylmuramoyl-L-alanine amidase